MAYRSVNLGIRPEEDYILDEKKIINGYKIRKYTLSEKIGQLAESLSENTRKIGIIKGQLSKEIVVFNKSNSQAVEKEIEQLREGIRDQKTAIKEHIRRCQLNGDTLDSVFHVDEITGADDFEAVQEKPEPEVAEKHVKRIPLWVLYLVEVLFIFGEGVLFYNILTETHDLPVIILRSVFFIPIVFAASFLTSRKISLRWVWLPALLILGVYAILSFTVVEWFFESKALDETLTFPAFLIKNGFLILGAVMMVTLALFLTNAVKSIYSRRDAKEKPKLAIPEAEERSPQQLDLELKFHELRGSYKLLSKLMDKLAGSQLSGRKELERILGDVSVLENKTAGISAEIGVCEKELDTLEINSFEEISKYREHFENYNNGHGPVQWKHFDFRQI